MDTYISGVNATKWIVCLWPKTVKWIPYNSYARIILSMHTGSGSYIAITRRYEVTRFAAHRTLNVNCVEAS